MRYYKNELFFEKIDTEQKAYWLGFITADGYVTKNGFSINLASKDKEHLLKLNTSISANYKLLHITKPCISGKIVEQDRLTVYSQKISKDLYDLGLYPNKSFTVKHCEQVPDFLESHYWRGLIDGDGFISYTEKDKCYRIGLVGTYDICEYFLLFAQKNGIKANPKVRKHYSIFQICFGGKTSSHNLIDLLYTNATIYLDRKMILAKKCLYG
jgi:hypothetical protein